jgi:hypothetical protein
MVDYIEYLLNIISVNVPYGITILIDICVITIHGDFC